MMGLIQQNFWRKSEGTTAVEFGIIAFPLFLMVFGILEFGRAMWIREALQQTAIAGARCMGLVQSNCGTSGTYDASMALSFVRAQAAAWSVPLSSSNVTLDNAATCGGLTGFSQVSLTYTFRSVVPVMIPSLGSGVPLSAVACFPKQS